MHISIADDTKKRFHADCDIRGLKMSQVVVELIEQWLKNTENSLFSRSKEYEEDFDIISKSYQYK